MLTSLTNLPAAPYHGIYFPSDRYTESTALAFKFRDDPGFLFLDDVSVNAVPLPAALPLFATGLGALGLLGWRRKRCRVSAK